MDILNIYFFEYKNKNMWILLMKNLTKCKYLSFYSEICNTNIADAKSDKIRIFININLLYETGNWDIKIRRLFAYEYCWWKIWINLNICSFICYFLRWQPPTPLSHPLLMVFNGIKWKIDLKSMKLIEINGKLSWNSTKFIKIIEFIDIWMQFE